MFAVAWILHVTRVGVITGALVGTMTAGGLLHKIAVGWIHKIGGWFKKEVTEIVQLEIAPVRNDLLHVKEAATAAAFLAKTVAENIATKDVQDRNTLMIKEIQMKTNELKPDSGTNLYDTVNEIDHNVKEIKDHTVLPEGK